MSDTNIIGNMTNLGDSGQDAFVQNWTEYAKMQLFEQGVSNQFINSNRANYILAKMVTDLIEDGDLSNTTLSMIATLRVNYPRQDDEIFDTTGGD